MTATLHRFTRTLCGVVTALGLTLVVVPAATAAELDAVKALYAEASYEAALQALDKLDTPANTTSEAQQYRVLCLLALGRSTDAQRAAETLITSAPTVVPSAEEFPPRFITLFTETRRRILPAIVTKAFADARDQFRASKQAEAATQFEKVLALTNDPMLQGSADVEDIRTLASGFLDLLKGRSAAPVPAANAAAARPATAVAPGAPTATTTAATPIASVAAASRNVTPSVPIRQELPAWVAPDRFASSREWNGSVKIVIGADGRVKSAAMERRMPPSYEAQLLAATRNWLYKPAMMGNQPVESERVLEVQLKPPTERREE